MSAFWILIAVAITAEEDVSGCRRIRLLPPAVALWISRCRRFQTSSLTIC